MNEFETALLICCVASGLAGVFVGRITAPPRRIVYVERRSSSHLMTLEERDRFDAAFEKMDDAFADARKALDRG